MLQNYTQNPNSFTGVPSNIKLTTSLTIPEGGEKSIRPGRFHFYKVYGINN